MKKDKKCLSPETRKFSLEPPISRRRFIQLVASGLTWLAIKPRVAFATPNRYRVGVGKSSDPYTATLRAVAATGEWPSAQIAGKTVVIKPNIVFPMAPETAVITDPEVIRALVDLALEDGAEEVLIIENALSNDHFSISGYGFFNSYNKKVRLIDLRDEPVALAKVPDGLAYFAIYLPKLILSDNVFFISAAKLKTHSITLATLSMKNLMGLTPPEKYLISTDKELHGTHRHGIDAITRASQNFSYNRFGLHHRGLSQAIVDLNLARPIDYAVVDGIWGMEGDGPFHGDLVRMDVVFAGKNPVAVDRVCLKATDLSQGGVKYLAYASRKRLGPKGLKGIDILGDPFTQRSFKLPSNLPPLLEYPKVFPQKFSPSTGQEIKITYWMISLPCLRRVDIVQTSDLSPEDKHIRILRDWELFSSGTEKLTWNGRDDNGEIAPPGIYCVRVHAKYDTEDATDIYASGWINVA